VLVSLRASMRECWQRICRLIEDGVEGDRELLFEDARSIREGLRRLAHLVQDAAEGLDARIEDETLDGHAPSENRLSDRLSKQSEGSGGPRE
jgi:hypothetical protein